MGAEEDLNIHRMESQQQGSLVDDDIIKPTSDNEIVRKYGETKRGLKPRHVHLMAIGGSIGVGLWASSF